MALTDDPWIRYRDTGLFVVPSVHGRLVFAHLVVEACRRRRFDVLAVELPASHAHDGSLDWIRDLSPGTGMLLRAVGRPVRVELARDTAGGIFGGPSTVLARRADAIPVTPSDSIVMALRCPRLLADRWPGWHPEIVPIDADHRPTARPALRGRIVDDYAACVEGLSVFHDRWRARWRSARIEPLDMIRERVMASHLARFVKEGREVLFVCGAAHWQPIADLLDDGVAPGPAAPEGTRKRRSRTADRIVAVEPSLAWLWGWLDDVPGVVWEFERACQEGKTADWDKRDATRGLLAAALERLQQRGHAVSARRLIKMHRYRDVLLSADGRWTPELDDHIVHTANTCVSRRFGEALKRLALEYPVPDHALPTAVSLSRTTDGRGVLHVRGAAFLCEPEDPAIGSGRRLPLPLDTGLTATERVELGTMPWIYRDWPAEQMLHNRLIARARLLAHRSAVETTVRRFEGTLGLGVAWRRTLRSHAAGTPELYVRLQRGGRRPSRRCDGRCPVVWVFDAETPATQTFTGIVPRDAHTHVPQCYSAFYWLTACRQVGQTPIQQFVTAYSVSLMRGLMGSGRHRSPASVNAMVASFPAHRRATIAPWRDRSLGAFAGFDLAVAAAIKYAGDHVIVVSLPSHAIGTGVEAFARERRVRIIRISRDQFERSALERLSLDHNVPAPAHWERPFAWCERFVPDMDGVVSPSGVD